MTLKLVIDKVEFSDLYKFSASVGLILIGLSIATPWLINHDVSFVSMKYSDINDLSASGKAIITKQQKTLELINNNIIFLCSFLFLSGIALLAWSIKKWNERQTVVDSLQDEELKSKQFQNLSIEEKRDQIAEENNIDTEENEIQLPSPDLAPKETSAEFFQNAAENIINSIIDIENRLYKKISSDASAKYLSLQNIKSNEVNFDILLESRFQNLKHRIIEIQVFHVKLSRQNLIRSLHRIDYAKETYEKNSGKNTVAVLLVVINDNLWANSGSIENWFFEYPKSAGLKLVKIKSSNVDTIDSVKLGIISKLNGE